MKKISFVLLALLVSMSMSLMAQEKEMEKAKEEMKTMAPPNALDDDWSKWIVGEWEGKTETPMGKHQDWMKIELGLDNQFIMMKYKSKMAEMTPEQMTAMKETMNMSDEGMAKMKDMVYKGLGIETVNPATGEVIGYWFDSWRGVYKGTGKREGNKTTMNWEGPMGSSTRTVEKVDENKMVMTFTETMPNGKVIEGRSEFTRKEMTTEKY
jgi:hypothetical protein